MEITLAGWMIPALVTLLAFGWVCYIAKDDGGFFAGLGTIMALGMVSPFVAIAWAVYAIFK